MNAYHFHVNRNRGYKMRAQENPFYILGASPMDHQERLISLYEEKKDYHDSTIYEEAKSVLLSPQRRTYAELCWFPGLSSTETAEILRRFAEHEYIDAEYDSAMINFNIAYENYFHMDLKNRWF